MCKEDNLGCPDRSPILIMYTCEEVCLHPGLLERDARRRLPLGGRALAFSDPAWVSLVLIRLELNFVRATTLIEWALRACNDPWCWRVMDLRRASEPALTGWRIGLFAYRELSGP